MKYKNFSKHCIKNITNISIFISDRILSANLLRLNITVVVSLTAIDIGVWIGLVAKQLEFTALVLDNVLLFYFRLDTVRLLSFHARPNVVGDHEALEEDYVDDVHEKDTDKEEQDVRNADTVSIQEHGHVNEDDDTEAKEKKGEHVEHLVDARDQVLVCVAVELEKLASVQED